VLAELSDTLKNSLGPRGSVTNISRVIANPQNASMGVVVSNYSKDGHTILSAIKYDGVIEQSIKTDIEDITRDIVKNVGDGTTSAVIMSNLIYNGLSEILETHQDDVTVVIDAFEKMVGLISDHIDKNVKEFDVEMAYDIAHISTNGNDSIAELISNLYKKYGKDLYIYTGISNNTDTVVKEYDGLTLNHGFRSDRFVNTTTDGKLISRIRNAKVYIFKDPVDTPEMISFMRKILSDNLYDPIEQAAKKDQKKKNLELVPTVIMAPKFGRDSDSELSMLENFVSRFPAAQIGLRPPILLVEYPTQADIVEDIAFLSSAKYIKKYLSPETQKADIEAGKAPTPETVHKFAGTVECVEADNFKTKFINPVNMIDEQGNPSDLYKTLVSTLSTQLKRIIEESANLVEISSLKRRLRSLQACMVDLLVGGISIQDRDALKAAVEDAVLNCRSAAEHGVGYGANFEGLRASSELCDTYDDFTEFDRKVMSTIVNAYRILVSDIYGSSDRIDDMLKDGKPYNIRGGNVRVLSSIETDKAVLKAISKIVTLAVTTNQFLCPDFTMNKYVMEKVVLGETFN
jgi:chaperonin GroEL (HSP60 family)